MRSWSTWRCPRWRTTSVPKVDGLQWVVDGHILMFGALLLSAGRAGGPYRRAPRVRHGAGGVWVAASLACGWAPSLAVLIAARLAQGTGAAAMMPAVDGADPPGLSRSGPARPGGTPCGPAGGSVAATFGPVIGGWLVALTGADFLHQPAGRPADPGLLCAHASTAAPSEVLRCRARWTAVLAMGIADL